MGGIRRQRKKIVTPGHPYESDRLERELPIVGEYGLRNKRELWRARTILSTARQQARALLALAETGRKSREEELINRLIRFGMLKSGDDLDSVLALNVQTVLERRLQTVVYRKGLATSLYQARHFVAHRHISINGRIVTSPGHLVTLDEEESVMYAPLSPLSKDNHPARPSAPPVVEKEVEQKGRTRKSPGKSDAEESTEASENTDSPKEEKKSTRAPPRRRSTKTSAEGNKEKQK